jgi:SAM-dependent methyltransferase
MTVDDMPSVVREVARVLEPGGRFCIALLHPNASWVDAGVESYYESTRFEKRVTRQGLGSMNFHDVHRPLGEYTDALTHAGFVIDRLTEPTPGDAYVSRFPEAAAWRREPFLLHLRAVRAT